MAKILQFPKDYPAHQWAARRNIERLLALLGWDMARCMEGFNAGTPAGWYRLNDGDLEMMQEYLQIEYMAHQCVQKYGQKIAPAEIAPAKPHACKVLHLPTTPEIEARLKAAPKAKPAKAAKHKKTAQPQQAAAKPDSKARLIRKIKMVQRDCEKTLERFSDATYRAILEERYRAGSSKDLEPQELLSLLMYLKSLLNGDQSQGKTNPKASVDAPALLYEDKSGLNRCGQMRKIQALLAEKGKQERKYIRWSYALGILKRQTGGIVTDWEDATPRNLDAVITALAKDGHRKGYAK